MKVEDWLGAENQLGIDIWNKKYRYGDETFDEWLDRVSGGDADVRQLIVDKKFLFGGRILANRGLDKKGVKVTYSNCYVLAPPEDSIESIFDTACKMARTFSYGGGVGVDISKLAPRGAKVNNTAIETSGAVSFTDLYSMVTGLIGQHGRRGALMLSMSCEHPDIEEFMRVKTDVERVTKANMSIRVTDSFMQSVQDCGIQRNVFHRPETTSSISRDIDADKFFNELCDANYDYGEPGILFWDRISNWNMLSEYDDFSYAGTNPCGEQPLPPGGSCLLGSLNLAEFVEDGCFQWGDFRCAVGVAVRALNDVLDEGQPLHPLEEQRQSVRDWRQIGLGIMGLADMLIKFGYRYDSAQGRKLADHIAYDMITVAIEESNKLAQKYGPFPRCDGETMLQSDFIKSLDFNEYDFGDLTENIRKYGLRNSQLLTIAPTGTISTMIGVSGGIEPIFAKSYTRTTKSLEGGEKTYKVYTPIVKEYMEQNNITDESKLPDYFVTAQDIDYRARIDMQATWQKYIDASISSTVNIPENFPKEKVKDIYMYAWKQGCKGVTVFRDGCKRDSILTTKLSAERGVVESVGNDVIGKKRKLMTGCGSLHCSAFFDADGNLKEVFLNKGSTGGCNNYMIGLSRMISLAARSGCSVDDIVGQLKSCGSCPSYAVRRATKGDTSEGACCPMAVANALIEMRDEMQGKTIPKAEVKNPCPKCGAELEFQGGCNVCKSCGWTRCD
ncbi:MAG: adenosylcobalamin-dependent ribonucleoside-diphosphate reductase [Bacteroidaceae bacterium]|nr:adenosylcobalamin-dependent ribonucleoside-diphosphate reductase [Bacteroidaceae bacterium]